MSNKPNIYQEAINNTHGVNVVVPASAGTGKTTTLTNRIINYINEGNEIDNYLILSYTETAASELKEKIANRIKDEIDNTKDEKNKLFLQKQLAKLPLAHISTIHAFCLDVLKKYSYVINIDPGISGKLASGGLLEELRQEALDKAIDLKKYNNLLFRYTDKPQDISDFKDSIKYLDQFIENIDDEEKWKKQAKSLYEKDKNGNSKINELLSKTLKEDFTEYKNAFEEKMDIYKNPSKQTPSYIEKTIPTLENAPALLNSMEEDLKKNDLESFINNFNEIKNYEFSSCDASIQKGDDTIKDRNEKLNKIKKDKEKSVDNFTLYLKVMDLNKDFNSDLIDIAVAYRKEFNELKKENGVIGFEDMLTNAKEILEHKEIADIYRNKFKEILVDEYQDTNQYQEDLLSLIKKDNNVFRVGDIKQSIFSFQNAKPEIMRSFMNLDDSNYKVLPLRKNYRSYPRIINFVNSLFDILMNYDGLNAYGEDDKLIVPEINEKKEADKIRIITTPYKTNEEKNLRAHEKAYFMAKAVAQDIYKKRKEENIPYSSFGILLRKNKNKKLIQNILTDYGIPSYTTTKAGFFSDNAVTYVLSFLNLIVNEDNLDKLIILTSPLFEYDYDKIVENYDSFKTDKGLDKDLNEFIESLRLKQNDLSLTEIIDEIYAYKDFYMNKTSRSERSNLDSLYNLVLEFQKDSNNIKGLISYLSSLKTVDKEEANSFSNKDDVVSIMTVHQSKGMTIDYVYYLDLAFGTSHSKYSGNQLYNEESSMAGKYISDTYKIKYPNPHFDLIKKEKQKKEYEEELRVMYVALTRAVKGLTIMCAKGKDNNKDQLESGNLYNKLFIDLIRGALLKIDNKDELVDEIDITIKDITDTEKEILDANKRIKTKSEKDYNIPLDEKLKEIERNIISPSKLKERNINKLNYFIKPGASRGTIMHAAIEKLGIKEIKKEDVDKLSLPLSKEDKEKVFNFYNHELTKKLFNYDNYNEYPFIYKDDEGLTNGIIDLLSIGKDIYIIDFKSDKNKNPEDLINEHSNQLLRYHSVISSYYKDKDIKVFIYSFELNDYVEIKT